MSKPLPALDNHKRLLDDASRVLRANIYRIFLMAFRRENNNTAVTKAKDAFKSYGVTLHAPETVVNYCLDALVPHKEESCPFQTSSKIA